jgi:hypothetical protein
MCMLTLIKLALFPLFLWTPLLLDGVEEGIMDVRGNRWRVGGGAGRVE